MFVIVHVDDGLLIATNESLFEGFMNESNS